MQVNKTPGEIARTEASQRAQQTVAPTPGTTEAPSAVHRVDAVQISDMGRALSGNDADASGEAGALNPRRADEIRSRVLSGAYNSVEMADQVARSILRSGDL
jgi:hypothetical protein